MIETTIENWHRYLKGDFPGGLDELLHDDCTFYSPVVFSPQHGKAITKLYLQAAQGALPGNDAKSIGEGGGSKFRYTKEICSGHEAMLEFCLLYTSPSPRDPE